MESTRFTAEFCGKTVLGFCHFPESSLMPLAADLSLTLSKAGLLHCQQYFATEALRDPTVGELKFIAALAVRMGELPVAVTLDALRFEDQADARIFADIMRQRAALEKTAAPTPADLLHTVTAYLARSGRKTKKKAGRALQVGESAYIAARADASALTLQVGDACAAHLPPVTQYTRRAGDLLLALRGTADEPLADTVKQFFAQYGAYSPAPLTLIGAEGLGVHLANLPMGAELDLAPLPDMNAPYSAPALLDACKDTLLLTCPQHTAAEMLREGAPLALIGRLTAGTQISVRCGLMPLITLSRQFLASFRTTRPATVTVPARTPTAFQREILRAEDGNTVLCAAVLDHAPAEALCHLLTSVYGAGGDMAHAELGTVLSLPLAADERALSAAISLSLPLHRFASELALSTRSLRVITAPTGEPTDLTVFLTAPKGAAPRDGEALKSALYQGDFATARRLLYPRTAAK